MAACSPAEPTQGRAPLRAGALPAGATDAASEATPRRAGAASTLLERIPEDALAVLRSADVSRLDDAWARTELPALFEQPQLAGAMTSARAEMLGALERGAGSVPGLKELVELLPQLSGELVVAFSMSAAGAGSAPGFEAILLFDAGERHAELRARLEPLLAQACADPEQGIERAQEGWGAHGGKDGAWFDLSADGTRFAILGGSRATVEARKRAWSSASGAGSFAGSALVTAARADAAGAGDGVLELYVQTAPLWKLVEAEAPVEIREFLRASKLTAIEGFAAAIALGERGLNESAHMRSPGCADLLGHALTARPMERELARWIPKDFDQAGLFTFDLQAFWTSLRAALPENARNEVDKTLDELAQGPRVDLRAHVIENLGPTFASATRGTLTDALSGALPRMCVAIQVRERARAQAFVDACLAASGVKEQVRELAFGGASYSALPLGPVGPSGETLELAWHLADDCIVLATGTKLLEEALLASRSADLQHAELARALQTAGEGVFTVAVTKTSAGRDATIAIGRRTEEGIRIDAREGAGGVLMNSLVVMAPMMSLVALPRLAQARARTSESATIAELRAVAEAQAGVRRSRIVDTDGDGAGEYLLLAELTGSAIPRGARAKLHPPALDARFEDAGDGCARRGGYLFRIDLSVGDGATSVVPRADDPQIVANEAERHFIVYAWPLESTGGGAAYAIDERGVVMQSDNTGDEQFYRGLEHAPRFDACAPQGNDEPPVWLGRDGGVWSRVEAPK